MHELILVGDRVLVVPDDEEKQTATGLYLPATVAARDRIQGGRVEQVGPGYVMPNPEFTGEPWAQQREAVRYLPLQARPGDYAFFLRKEAIELTFQEREYLVIPHAAILVLVRDDAPVNLEDLGF